MRKEQKPAMINSIIENYFKEIDVNKKKMLIERIFKLLDTHNKECLPVVLENTLKKAFIKNKFDRILFEEKLYEHMMMLDDESFIDCYFNKKLNRKYIDETELMRIIKQHFELYNYDFINAKEKLSGYIQATGLSLDTLENYIIITMQKAEELLIDKALISKAIVNYPGLLQQADWQYKYLMFARIKDRNRNDLLLDRGALTSSCKTLYSKIRILDDYNMGLDEYRYSPLLHNTNQSFLNHIKNVNKDIDFEVQAMLDYCEFWQDFNSREILPEVLAEILSWDGNEKIKEIFGSSK